MTAVIIGLDPGAWDKESPCEGWTARDVVAHIIDTQREFFSGRGFDPGDRPSLDDPAAAWREHNPRVARLLADESVPAMAFDGYFGPTTVGATFEQFYIWDLLVHRWDIAQAAGADTTFTDAELDRMEAGADSFGDAIYMDGVCKPGVAAPEGADRQARILARLGRRAGQ